MYEILYFSISQKFQIELKHPGRQDTKIETEPEYPNVGVKH